MESGLRRGGSGSEGRVRFRTAALGSLSAVAVGEVQRGDMVGAFGEESETRGGFELEAEGTRPVWIEVADKVRREYGFGGGAQPAKFLQVGVAGVVQFGGKMVGQWWMVFGWIAELRGVFGLCVELKEFALDYNAVF